MLSVDEIKKRAKDKTNVIIFICIVVVGILYNWLA